MKNFFIKDELGLKLFYSLIIIGIFSVFLIIFDVYFFVEYLSYNVLDTNEYLDFYVILNKAFDLLKYRLLIVVFIDVLMILGLCWFVSVRIITPKKELKRVIEKISDGNLNFELTEFEDKLFGDVFKNIDMMRAKLKKDLKLIKDAEKDSKLKPEEKSDKIKKVLDRYVL